MKATKVKMKDMKRIYRKPGTTTTTVIELKDKKKLDLLYTMNFMDYFKLKVSFILYRILGKHGK